jgi:S-(hydroxymethyl)glutathione dehydrogenase/alcohol dehydrogenase
MEITEAAVLFKLNSPLEIVGLRFPELKRGQVLVEIAYSGICHSQLNEIKGMRGPDKFLPHTLGHEGAGIVLSIGNEVTRVTPGDRVVMSWIKGAGLDIPSTQYKCGQLPINSGAISTFMTHSIVSENRLTRISQAIPLKLAALLGCAVPTGAGTVINVAKVGTNQSIAVFGAGGGIGMAAVMASKMMKAFPIIAIDISQSKLIKAKDLGATHLINSFLTDPVEEIKKITQSRGVLVALDCSGNIEAMNQAFSSVSTNHGLCIVAGNPPYQRQMSINPYELIAGKKLIGTWGGCTDIDKDIDYYIKMYLSGAMELDKLNTKEYRFNDINIALQELEDGLVGRPIINMKL